MTVENQPTEVTISPCLDVLKTQYGRACFANQDIPKGFKLLETSSPFAASVLYEFRREVCSMCYHYEYGKFCKFRLPKPSSCKKKNYLGAGLWFCSESCLSKWHKFDQDGNQSMVFETLLENYTMKAKNPVEQGDYDVKITKEFIVDFWFDIQEWESAISKMKKSKVMSKLPFINEDEYTTARFVTSALFSLYQHHESIPLYHELQSNEFQKIEKFPVLLRSQGVVYQFLRILLPDYLQPILTTSTYRHILGAEYGNSFGTWQLIDEGSNEEKEFLGYMLFPEASFFNHSCAPNVKKSRHGNQMIFETKADIKKGDQLCIDYFHILDEPFEVRQKAMADNWFFCCACDKCSEESSR